MALGLDAGWNCGRPLVLVFPAISMTAGIRGIKEMECMTTASSLDSSEGVRLRVDR